VPTRELSWLPIATAGVLRWTGVLILHDVGQLRALSATTYVARESPAVATRTLSWSLRATQDEAKATAVRVHAKFECSRCTALAALRGLSVATVRTDVSRNPTLAMRAEVAIRVAIPRLTAASEHT
jgi:hypothetical protein